ncbi:hypothetical protein CCC_00426 [Paramagnetospirillum magnetotacticum MS-1]|uniref:Uncharacterized protein n=1 Tax=Paramagnetospirillum magnetotacticum MS-1 TaxID=272627 RepID=A0A0C2YRN2_PARME|nr:hypothetical protein CCC_00426 [Paramagnetospirillum magnetotacticum MS-1]
MPVSATMNRVAGHDVPRRLNRLRLPDQTGGRSGGEERRRAGGVDGKRGLVRRGQGRRRNLNGYDKAERPQGQRRGRHIGAGLDAAMADAIMGGSATLGGIGLLMRGGAKVGGNKGIRTVGARQHRNRRGRAQEQSGGQQPSRGLPDPPTDRTR